MAHVDDAAPIGFPEVAEEKGLKTGALGLVSSVVIGMASTAPAYSLAASLGFVVATANGDGIVGEKAPSIMLLAFIPMLLIAIAYQQLNRAEPDCGTTFTWATRAFGPRVGWLGGWGIIAADVIVMANLAQIAGAYTFQLFGWDGLLESTFWTTFAGVVWIVIMTYICYRGIEVSARLQYALLGIEVIVLIAFSIIALFKVYSGSAPEGSLTPSLSWLWPSGMSVSALVTATLIAVFIYWGWDTAVAVNEETENPEKTPGRAAIISTVLLLVTYATVSVATVAFAGTSDTGLGLANPDNADDVFGALGPTVFGDSAVGKGLEILLILSVLSSAAASTQTTILPTARTSLAMGAFKALPSSFAKIHPRFLTPTVSTIWMGAVSIAFYVGMTLVSENVLGDTIAAVVLMKGLWPFLGGVMLLTAFVIASYQYAQPDYGSTTLWGIGGVFVLGIGSLLLGVVLMFIWNAMAPAFFRGETLPKRSASDLILEIPAEEGTSLRLPDSGLPDLIIAPDLSNLPEGAVALDLETGAEIDSPEDLEELREQEELAADREAADPAEDEDPEAPPRD